MSASSGIPDRITMAAFSGAVVIGGVNFVAVRISNRELAPFFGAGLRFIVAGLLLLGYVALRRIGLPRGRVLWGALAYGLLATTATYALLYWALQPQHLSAGVAAVVLGAAPLITVVLVAIHGLERFAARRIVGGIIAVAGITILANPFSAASVPLVPLLAVVGGALAVSESAVIIKLIPPAHPAATNAVGMTTGAILLLVISALSGEQWQVPTESGTWMSVAYLILLGSVGLFGLILFTLSRWTASAVSYLTPLFPVVAMVAGFVIAGEPITLNGVIGAMVVITAVYVGVLRTPRSPPRTARRLEPASQVAD